MKSSAKLMVALLAGTFVLSFTNISCSNGSDSSPLAFVPTSATNTTEPTNGGTGGDNGSGGGTTTSPTNPTNPTNPEQQTQTTFTVTFQTERGTLPDQFKNGITVNENDKLTAEQLPALTAEGFAFGGWLDGETPVVAGEYTVKKNVVLTAKWTVATVSYTVSFVNVGDEYSGCTSPSSVSLPSSVTLPENTILMETNIPEPTYNDMWYNNWRFDGWYEYKGKDYGWGEKVEAGKYVLKKDVTLIAIWIPSYTIRFDANGGTGEMPDYITAVGEAKILVCPEKDTNSNEEPDLKHEFLPNNAFLREGYIFDGWSRSPYSAEGGGCWLNLKDINNPKAETFYAIWKPITYTVRFDSQRGKIENLQYIYKEAHAYHYEDSVSGEYIFSWNTKPDGSGTAYPSHDKVDWRDVDIGDLSKEQDSVVTLYAQWKPSTYTIKLFGWDGVGTHYYTESGDDTVYMECVYEESYILTNPFITQNNRIFLHGWTYKGDKNNNVIKCDNEIVNIRNLTDKPFDTIELWPYYRSKRYYIVFDPNGGSGSKYNVEAFYGEEIALPKNKFYSNTYTFICWEGGYLDEETVKDLSTPGVSITLKAMWAKANETLALTAPVKNAISIINRLPYHGICSLTLIGECDGNIILQIGEALKAKNISLDLHLENTTGLKKISGLADCASLRSIYLPTETKIPVKALYGCTNLEGVYYPNYKSNRYIFKASGSSTNRWMTIEKKSNVPAYLTCEYQIDQGYGPHVDDPVFVNKVFANILTGNAEDPSIKTFRGYEYEWRVME